MSTKTAPIFRVTGLKASIAKVGKISGKNVNAVIEARVESDTITALSSVQTKGNSQTFAMESPGAWVSEISVDLVREPR